MNKRALDPVDFMALHLSALVFGGIGQGDYHETPAPYTPLCAAGHAMGFNHESARTTGPDGKLMTQRLRDASINPETNDTAVQAILKRQGRDAEQRVSFEDYAAEMKLDVKSNQSIFDPMRPAWPDLLRPPVAAVGL